MASDEYAICVILILFVTCFFCSIIILTFIRKFSKIMQSSRLYYLIIFLLISGKFIIYFIDGIKISKQFKNAANNQSSVNINHFFFTENIYVNLNYITNMGYMLLLTFICKRYLIFCCNIVVNKIQQKLTKFILFCQLIIFCLNLAIILTYNLEVAKGQSQTMEKVVFTFSAIANFLSVFCIFITQFYTNFKFTGTLFQEEDQKDLKHLQKLQLMFFISRSVCGVTYILKIGNINYELVYLEQQYKMILLSFLVLILTFFIDWIPIIMSVNNHTISIFSNPKIKRLKSSLLLTQQSNYIKIIQNSQIGDSENEMHIKNFSIQKQIQYTDSGFGVVMKSHYNNKLFMIRKIQTQLSKYLIEEIVNQIKQKKKLKIKSLINIKFSLIYQFLLYNLNNYFQTHKLTLTQKLNLAFKITVAIEEIHRMNLPHGSLNFNNIFIQNNEVKLGDHGLLPLKKFINLTKGYSNKSIYTAPQFLAQRSSIVSKPTREGDVYAFSLIMYEMFTQNFDYRTLSLKQIQKTFNNQSTRPKIPSSIPHNIANLIRSCWQQQASERPNIEQIKGILKQYCKL